MLLLGTLLGLLAFQTPGAPPATEELSSRELRIAYDEFMKLHKDGRVLVIDVRGEDAYRAGHIPGAISMPLDTVTTRAGELKHEKRAIVTYCS